MATIVAPGVRKRWADIEDSQEDSQGPPVASQLLHQESYIESESQSGLCRWALGYRRCGDRRS